MSSKYKLKYTCEVKYSSLYRLLTLVHYPYSFLNGCPGKCHYFQYKCAIMNYCIDVDNVCDGIKQCYHGDDELFCGDKITYISLSFHNITLEKLQKITLHQDFSNVETNQSIYQTTSFVIIELIVFMVVTNYGVRLKKFLINIAIIHFQPVYVAQ